MLFFILLIFLGVLLILKKEKTDDKDLPPGPWSLPLVGHLALLVPDPIPVLKEWKQKYGPIISCRFGSFPAVILLDAKLIREAFKMSEISGRPQLNIVQKTKLYKGFLFSEGSYKTEMQKFTIMNLRGFGVGRNNLDFQHHKSISKFLSFIKTVERKPVNSADIPSSHVLDTLWTLLMTDDLSPEETEKISHIVTTKIMNFDSPIAELAHFMPWLDKLVHSLSFGNISLTRTRAEGFMEMFSYVEAAVKEKRKRWVKGQGQGQQPRDLMELYFQKEEETTDLLSCFHASHNSSAYYATDLFFAGIHSSHVFLLWFFYYMAANPSLQKKLQEEIQLIIGSSRLPALEDRVNMPFAEATILELLRISSTSPMLIPHRAIKEVRLHGYTIKKDTLIFADAYGVHHDKEVWGDPDIFRPERWQNEQGKKLQRESLLPFSFGKIKCPGDRFAMDQLFLYITSISQQYNVELYGEKSKNVRGVYGLTHQPSEFQVIFTPRSDSCRL